MMRGVWWLGQGLGYPEWLQATRPVMLLSLGACVMMENYFYSAVPVVSPGRRGLPCRDLSGHDVPESLCGEGPFGAVAARLSKTRGGAAVAESGRRGGG